jgi:hypothetical protein
MAATVDFIKGDFLATLFPMRTTLIVAEHFEQGLSQHIYEKVLSASPSDNFLPQQRVFATKPRGHLRRTVKLDPVAEYYIYDLVLRNRGIFRKQVSEARASFGYRFEDGKPYSITTAFREFRKCVADNSAAFKHSVRFDVASYFNSIYHHDLIAWFSSRQGVSSEDGAGFGRYCREINAGRSVDFLPQGIYPAKMIGNEFLKFLELSGQIKSARTVRFMDDFYLFDDSESVLARDFVKIQQLLGALGLNINPSKTAYDEVVSDVSKTVTDIKKGLMQVVEIEEYIDTPSGVEVVTESVEIEASLDSAQVEALLEFLRSDALEESDADLILNILRAHSDSVLEFFPILLRKFPNIYKHLYSVALQVSDREELATILLDFLSDETELLEYQLFWLTVIAEESLAGTSKYGDILLRIFELTPEYPIARARVLEIPTQDFGFKEIRSDFLKTGASNWAAWASAAGSRSLNAGERNYVLDYFSKGSSINFLVASAVKAWVAPEAPKGFHALVQRFRGRISA